MSRPGAYGPNPWTDVLHLSAASGLTARSGQAELSAMPSMPAFNVSNTKPTFTEISYTKLRTFPKFDMNYYHNQHIPMVQQKLGPACVGRHRNAASCTVAPERCFVHQQNTA
jgi:hypothetical protein